MIRMMLHSVKKKKGKTKKDYARVVLMWCEI